MSHCAQTPQAMTARHFNIILILFQNLCILTLDLRRKNYVLDNFCWVAPNLRLNWIASHSLAMTWKHTGLLHFTQNDVETLPFQIRGEVSAQHDSLHLKGAYYD